MGGWYRADWQPGVDGAGLYRPRGEPVELRGGGPLDGREGHVYNGGEALWVAIAEGEFVVRSALSRPVDLPAGASLLGRYVLDVRNRSLVWDGLVESGPLGSAKSREGAPAAPYPVATPRARFGPLWQEGETPPSPALRLWRRLVQLVLAAR